MFFHSLHRMSLNHLAPEGSPPPPRSRLGLGLSGLSVLSSGVGAALALAGVAVPIADGSWVACNGELLEAWSVSSPLGLAALALLTGAIAWSVSGSASRRWPRRALFSVLALGLLTGGSVIAQGVSSLLTASTDVYCSDAADPHGRRLHYVGGGDGVVGG